MASRPDPTRPGFVVGDSLADIFAEVGIAPGRASLTPGGQFKLVCPACGGGSAREKSLSLKVDDDGAGAAWQCKRGTCSGFVGNGRIGSHTAARDRDMEPAEAVRAPKPAKVHRDPARPPALYNWAAARRISAETVDTFGLFMADAWFPQVEEERLAIAFPYRCGGHVVGHKYRDSEKNHAQDPGTMPTLFNVDSLAADDVAYWVEGEPDVLAMHEAGYRQVVSLRDGAPAEVRPDGDPRIATDKRFAAMGTHAAEIERIKRWIIATDGDGPGENLAAEIMRRIGIRKCWRVIWPEGCKDAGDVLRQHGPARLQEVVEAAQPVPMKGLVHPAPEQALMHRQRGRILRGLDTGIAAMDAAFKMPVEGGRLIVVTGPPNHGKSPIVRQVMVRLAGFHGVKFVVAAPEEGSSDVMVEFLTQLRSGAPFWPGATPHMTDAELSASAAWVGRHFAFVQADDPDEALTIEYVLARAEAAKARMGARYLFIDPWNEFEWIMERGETETMMTSRVLRLLKAWGRAHGMDIIIVVHPSKPTAEDRKNARPPDGYDIAGSANWNNKPDLGLTVWRPTSAATTEVHVWKAKNQAWGRRGNKATLAYDMATGRYSSADMFQVDRRVP